MIGAGVSLYGSPLLSFGPPELYWLVIAKICT